MLFYHFFSRPEHRFDPIFVHVHFVRKQVTQLLFLLKSKNSFKTIFFRDSSSDLYRARAALEEVTEQLDASKRENKNLSQEVKDLLEQIGDGGRSLHEVEKQCRRLEEEKEELANALDEAEAALEQVDDRFVTLGQS
jgi:chromosome segregation ATPase